MKLYYLSFFAAAVISAVLTPLLVKFAQKRHIFMTEVRERDLHKKPTPRVGGIAVVVSFLVVTAAFIIFSPTSLVFTGAKVWGIDKNLFGVLLSVILLSAFNVADDFKSLPWQIRLFIQTVVALMIVAFGVNVPWLSSPFGGKIILGAFSSIFSILWLVGLTNVINWLDGVDGLAGGVSAIAMVFIIFLSVSSKVNNHANALLATAALGAIAGFLPFNIVRAKAFLGDTGSQFVGFMVGVLAIISGGKIATAFLVLAIPFLDAIVVLGSRIIHHQSPFQADKRHLHHRLLDIGFKPWQIVGLYYFITALFGLIAVNTESLGKLQASMFALALMMVLVLLYSYGGKRNVAKNI